MSYTTRPVMIPWTSDNGLCVDTRTSRTITLRWHEPKQKNIEAPDTSIGTLWTTRHPGTNPKPSQTPAPPEEPQEPTLFEIQMMKHGTEEWVTIYQGYADSFVVQDLKPNTNVSFRMRRNNEKNWGSTVMGCTEAELPTAEDLHKAVQFNSDELVMKIISVCNPSYKKTMLINHDRAGNTPLIAATLNGSERILVRLLNVGAEVNATSLNTKKTALMVACFQGDLPCIQVLDSAGADWTLRDLIGCNAIHHAVKGESVRALNYALTKRGIGAIDGKDRSGWTPLLRAVVMESSFEIVKTLLKHGANPNAKDKHNSKSCLFGAVMLGRTEIAAMLLEYKADATYRNVNGQTVLKVAEAKEVKSLINLIRKALGQPLIESTTNLEQITPVIPAGRAGLMKKLAQNSQEPPPIPVSLSSKPAENIQSGKDQPVVPDAQTKKTVQDIYYGPRQAEFLANLIPPNQKKLTSQQQGMLRANLLSTIDKVDMSHQEGMMPPRFMTKNSRNYEPPQQKVIIPSKYKSTRAVEIVRSGLQGMNASTSKSTKTVKNVESGKRGTTSSTSKSTKAIQNERSRQQGINSSNMTPPKPSKVIEPKPEVTSTTHHERKSSFRQPHLVFQHHQHQANIPKKEIKYPPVHVKKNPIPPGVAHRQQALAKLSQHQAQMAKLSEYTAKVLRISPHKPSNVQPSRATHVIPTQKTIVMDSHIHAHQVLKTKQSQKPPEHHAHRQVKHLPPRLHGNQSTKPKAQGVSKDQVQTPMRRQTATADQSQAFEIDPANDALFAPPPPEEPEDFTNRKSGNNFAPRPRK